MMNELDDIQDVLLRLESSLPICRICLDVSMEYIEFDSPFCVINGEEITYSDAFHEVSSCACELPNETPTNLCSACGNDLLNTYLFLKRVETTNCILEKIKNLDLKSQSKNEAKVLETDDIGESLKVEILNDTNCAKCLASIKLENQTESASPCLNIQLSLKKKVDSDIKPKCSDTLSNKTLCIEKCFVDGDIDEIPETKEFCAEHFGKNDLKSAMICTQCYQKCLSEEEFRQHLLDHEYSRLKRERHNKDVYNCILCKSNFETEALLMAHINAHADRGRCKNPIHKTINSKSLRRKSHKSVEEKKRKRLDSKDAFRLPTRLKNNLVNQQTETIDFTCTFCEKKYLTAIGLKSHSRVHKEKKCICHFCSKMCSTESTLKRHIDHIHLSDCKKYQCEDCGLVFKYPSYLKDHQRKHDTKKKYKCPFCDRSYCRKPQFDIHLRYHYNDYRYKCNHCNKGYATKSNLTDHIKSSHIKITYNCDKCDQKFKSITGLKKHKYSHTGYPYNCPLCLLGQASRSGIKTHIFGVHRGAITMDEFNKLFPLVHPKSGYRRPKANSTE